MDDVHRSDAPVWRSHVVVYEVGRNKMSKLIYFNGSGTAVLSDYIIGFDRDKNNDFIVYLKHGGSIKAGHSQMTYEVLMEALEENARETE